MASRLTASTVLIAVALSAPASAADWIATGAGNGHGETLSLAIDPVHSYIFECAPDAVLITNTGITDILDLRSGGKVGDAPGSVMPDGAALMALATSSGDPKFRPAQARPNSVKGWDFTLRLAKTDPALKALEKATMLSLFTTGYTAAVDFGPAAKARYVGFMARCRG